MSDYPSIDDAPVLLRGARFDIRAIQLPRRDGQTAQREVIVHPGAVTIVPWLDDRQVVMIRNRRPAVGQRLLELPAGTLEAGEDPAVCASREVLEETGYRADRVRPMLSFFTSPGICTERMFVYEADGLEQVGQQLDPTERIDVEVTPFDRTIELIRDGVIQDAKSIAALLYAHAFGRPEGGAAVA